MTIVWIKKRKDFVRATHYGAKIIAKSLILQAVEPFPPLATPTPRLGITVTKKIGNAVQRNRARRRLKAALRNHFKTNPVLPLDYVTVARPNSLTDPFTELEKTIAWVFKKHRKILDEAV